MLVSVAQGTVGSGNLYFGSDNVAEVAITASADRAFREPGIVSPGAHRSAGVGRQPRGVRARCLIVSDSSVSQIFGGSSFSAVGVIGYEFGDYELWPTSLLVTVVQASVQPVQRAHRRVSSPSAVFNGFPTVYESDSGLR